jgi:hypothetical protein
MAQQRRPGGTDYAKFDKIDYAALGADDDDEGKKKKRAGPVSKPADGSRGQAQSDGDEEEPFGETPQGRTKAFLKHQADVEAAKKRLVELDKEQEEAELKLLRLKRDRERTDKMLRILAFVFVLIVLFMHWYANGSNAFGLGENRNAQTQRPSAPTPGDHHKPELDDDDL